jgi:beta-lactamase regulating signal transducer with metallopeptidase domain
MHDALWLLVAATALTTLGVCAVALLRPVVGRWAGAEARYALWLLVPVLLLAVGLARALPQPPVVWQVVLPASDWALGAPTTPRLAAGHAARPAAEAWAAPTALLVVWAAGVLALSAALTAQHLRFARRPLAAGASAALQGAWRPRVRLPVDFRARFPKPERRLVLLHERVHAERGDTRWTALALALLVLQWFNPVAWWAMRRLRQDMELAADAAVLRRRPQDLQLYRRALLRAQDVESAPISVSPCATHPLIERIAMLPAHLQRPRCTGWVALLLATAAGVAWAVQPTPAPLPMTETPQPAAVQAVPAPAAIETAPAASAPPVPPAESRSVSLAPGAEPATQVESVPPVASGYSKLRLDIVVTHNGHRLPPDLVLQTFGEVKHYGFVSADGSGVRVSISGRPYSGDEVKGQDLILLELTVIDRATGHAISRPRLVTKDGVQATIEMGEESGQMLRIEVLPRFVQTRLHGSIGALAELKREIEAGQAPDLYFKP